MTGQPSQNQPQSQSWSSWILDSYASSVVPHEEEYAENVPSQPMPYDPSTFEPKPLGRISTAPAFEPKPLARVSTAPTPGTVPYIKTGRGGAGNYIWQSEKVLIPEADIESQRQSSLTERQKAAAQIDHADTKDLPGVKENQSRKKSSQYLRVGVGGAGNLSLRQSNEIQSPRSSSFNKSPPSFSKSPTTPEFINSHGRGGAGNWEHKADMDRKVETEKEYEERINAEKTREKIEMDVESLLKRPEGAIVSPGRRDVVR